MIKMIKKRGEIFKDKKGISIMIGYVLLISISLIIAVLVFNWAKTLVPKPELSCPEGASLVVNDLKCVNGELKLELYNNGKRRIDDIYFKGKTNQNRQIANLDLSDPNAGEIIGLSGAMDPGGRQILAIPFYDLRCTNLGTECTTDKICSGGEFDCSILSEVQCNNLFKEYGCSYDIISASCKGRTISCEELTGLTGRIPCNTAKNAMNSHSIPNSCEWYEDGDINHYQIYEIEITPERQQENNKGKKESVVCNDGIIKQQLEKCHIYPTCGDGVVNQLSENCDDGNNDPVDGCDNNCQT